MRVERVNLDELSAKSLDLGFVGEQNHTKIIITCAMMFKNYPDAVATMVVNPPVGDLYPVQLTRDGNTLEWDVSTSDLAYAGSGSYQLTFTENEEIIKVEYGSYFVKASMTSTGEPPVPLDDWMQEATAALEALEEISASASTLAAGSSATAEITTVEGHRNIAIGIPKGEKGDTGNTGLDGYSPTATVLKSGTTATITITDKTGTTTAQVSDGVATDAQVTTAVDNYLEANFSNPSNPPLDRTLSSSSSAAPADLCGDLRSAIDDNLNIKIADGIYALDWIESDGTAYINSGVNPSSTLEFEIDFINRKTPSANPYANLIGSRVASKNNDFEISTYVTSGYSGIFRIGNENFNAYLKTGERQKISYKNGKYNVDGTDYTVSNGISSNSYPIYIFSLNSAGASTYPLNARIYSVKLWDSGSLVRDYVPAYKNATNEAGLYDKVNNVFYGKATGSAFTYQFTQRIEKEVSKIMDYNPPYKRMSIELEKGGYDTSGDPQADATGTRWRTKNFIYVSDMADTNIHVPVGFVMYVCQYSEGNTFITRGTWNSGSVHDVKSLYSIKWTIIKSSWTASTEEEANCVDIKQKPAWYNYLTSGVNNLYEYPDYFKTQLISVSSNFISDMLSVGADGDGFVFITDVHWNGNYKHSPNLIYYLKNKTNLNMILCGGDLIDRSTTSKSSQVTDMQNCIKAFKGIGIPFITAIGNHDRNSAGVSDSTLYLSENEVFSITQNPVNMMQLHYADIDSRTCFYFDKTATKTRYIFIDSGKNNIGTFDITNDEVTWVSNTIVATPAEYHIIIIVHSLGEYQSLNDPIGESNPFVYTSGATSLLSTLDGLLSSHKIEVVFAGHTHVDDNAVTTGGIPIVWTNSDALWQYHGMTQPSDGTVDSQCFDVVTMDYVNKTIKLRRVGRGSDRTITYGS